MNWAQFKDPVCSIRLAGTVIAPWSPTQEIAGSSPFNDKYFLMTNILTNIFLYFLFNKKIYD